MDNSVPPCFTSVADLKPHLEEAHLFIAPLKPDSTLFGVETLEAIAAGVPALVSENCGVVSLLNITEDSVISENTHDVCVNTGRTSLWILEFDQTFSPTGLCLFHG